jgi:hypothetical protein
MMRGGGGTTVQRRTRGAGTRTAPHRAIGDE